METSEKSENRINYCVIIPTYNNHATVGGVIRDVLAYTRDIIVINDGSTDGTEEVLRQFPGISVLKNEKNRGKGFSLRKGFAFSLEKGFDYAITLDSDGQHLAKDIPVFIDKIREEPETLIIGARNMNVDNVPTKSSVGKKFSNFWITVTTGLKLQDTQSGYRLYPIRKMAGIRYLSKRFEFEVEAIVKAVWQGIPVTSVPVSVYYAPVDERISHYRPFVDFIRISLLNVLLVTLAIFTFWPKRFAGHHPGKSFKQIFKDEILQATGSNFLIAASIGFGIFMGITPIWGYQLLVGFTLAHFLKLNKAIFFVAANISIPPVIPVLLFLSFYTGGLLMGNSAYSSFSIQDMSFDISYAHLKQYVLGAIVFAAVSGTVVFLASYLLLTLFRKRKTT